MRFSNILVGIVAATISQGSIAAAVPVAGQQGNSGRAYLNSPPVAEVVGIATSTSVSVSAPQQHLVARTDWKEVVTLTGSACGIIHTSVVVGKYAWSKIPDASKQKVVEACAVKFNSLRTRFGRKPKSQATMVHDLETGLRRGDRVVETLGGLAGAIGGL